jgi:signal transduction histidine kinase
MTKAVKLENSKNKFVIMLVKITFLFVFINSFIFYFTGAPGTAVLFLTIWVIFFSLIIQLFRMNYDTAAKFLFIFQGLVFHYIVLSTISTNINSDFYYFVILLIPLLIFDGKQKTEIFIGLALPFFFWILEVNHLLPPIPLTKYNLDSYHLLFYRINFLGALLFSAFFLNFYRIFIVTLNEAKNKELEKLKILSQHLNNSQRIAKIGSWQYNFSKDELVWSDEIYNIFEVSRDSFSPTMEVFDRFIHPDDFLSVTKAFRDAIKDNGSYKIDHRIILKEDRIKFLREQCEIDYDLNGHPKMAMGTTQDITESKLNDELINHSAKMAAVGEMASSIAHEINNPLTVISGRANLLMKKVNRIQLAEENNREEIKNDLSRIIHHVDRISRIVKSLGNISRNDKNDPLQLVPIQKLFDEINDLSSESFRAKGVELSFETSSDAKILCRPSEMSQVFLNLLNNAFDAIADLNEKWIYIKAIQESDLQKIVFMDSGKGISKPVAQKLMFPFFTTKPPGKGTGLGLSISKKIIEKYNGKLYYDEHSSNTCFIIELPLSQ